MLLPSYPQDAPDVLRASYKNLCDPEWWKSLYLDGLVLYSWAAPRYNAVARAVHLAGVRSVVYMDTHGLISPLGNPQAWWKFGWRPTWALAGNSFLKFYSFAKFLIDSSLLITARRRVRHLTSSHITTLPTRAGVTWMKQELAALGRSDLAEKVFYSPHPQKILFNYNHAPKENLVVSVARFRPEDWAQKRPDLLIKALNTFLKKKPDWKAIVVGNSASQLEKSLRLEPHKNIQFLDYLAHEELVKLYQKAKIGFWTSLWEGQQGTAAQALCCGCSVVAPESPLNNCFGDYVSTSSGRLAVKATPQFLAESLFLEVDSWQEGARNPAEISAFAKELFHAPSVAKRILSMILK